jgi:hypothetical protein
MSTTITVRVPVTIRKRGGRRLVVAPDGAPWSAPRPRVDNTLVKALARAHRWKKMLDDGRYGSVTELAAGEKLDRGYLGKTLTLTLLAPDIVQAIMDSRRSSGCTCFGRGSRWSGGSRGPSWPPDRGFQGHCVGERHQLPRKCVSSGRPEGIGPGTPVAVDDQDGEVSDGSRANPGREGERDPLSRALRLTLLAPDIVEAILDGGQPEGVTLTGLMEPFPTCWPEQRASINESSTK